jgi:hypothetical protein
MNKLFSILFVILINTICVYSQESATTNMTFFFVDNSSGYKADALNQEMIDQLKDKIAKAKTKFDNSFFFYGCDGEEPKSSSNAEKLLGGPTLKSYLNKESIESEYKYDLNMLREYFVESAFKIKQNLEINLFLSANAMKRMFKRPSELPPALVFTRELPIYLNNSSLDVKINLYVNKDLTSEFSEQAIKDYFNFCNNNLGIKSNLQLTIL